MKKTSIFLFITIGGALLLTAQCVGSEDQSDPAIPDDQPIGSQANSGDRTIQAPEVVLQLKYDGGELNRIYLAQFRKRKTSLSHPVPERTDLCADLCHAGLGGEACGAGCPELIPVGLQSALHSPNDTTALYGQPRVAVCPTLCQHHLGEPLCSCAKSEPDHARVVDWAAICSAFCADKYVLGGCPACDESLVIPQSTMSRILDTNEGWSAWCNVQCRQGQGGAACNCDRAPFQ